MSHTREELELITMLFHQSCQQQDARCHIQLDGLRLIQQQQALKAHTRLQQD